MDTLLNMKQLGEIETQSIGHNIDLIDRAGLASFEWLKSNFSSTTRILVIVGIGDNASYALALVEQLIINNYRVDYIYIQSNVEPNYSLPTSIAKQALTTIPDDITTYGLIVDALYDLRITQNIDSGIFEMIHTINNSASYILSLDTPSGVNPFTGAATHLAINADTTLTFISDKAGLHTGDGIDYSGEVLVASLVDITDFKLSKPAQLIEFNSLTTINYHTLIRQKLNTSKGTYGTVAIIGGNNGMHGAIYLAGRAALMAGIGKVVLVPIDNDFQLDFTMPELMQVTLQEMISNISSYTAIAIGPGFGRDAYALQVLHDLLDVAGDIPLVVDADALNLIATNKNLHRKFKAIKRKIITPHPGEASRLLNTSVDVIQNDRFKAIDELSVMLSTTVVLKGAGTLIGNEHSVYINTTGNPGLANAGQGDTLTGIIVGLLALRLDILDAARFGVYLHGAAGDRLVIKNRGYHGILASNVAQEVSSLLNDLLYGNLFKD